MDQRKLFQNVVTNQYMPDFDYINYDFSFQTVFYQSVYSYCCCSCGFEHEYLDYISDRGTINEKIFEKMVKCIVNRKCDHVDKVPQEYVKETGIYGIHIAAVVGTEKALINHQEQYHIRRGKLFGQDPYVLAVLKKHNHILSLPTSNFVYFTNIFERELLLPIRATVIPNEIKLEKVAIAEYCVRTKDTELLKHYVDFLGLNIGDNIAFQLTLKHNLQYMQELMLSDSKWVSFVFRNSMWDAEEWCRLAVIYNKPDILGQLLNSVSYTFMDTVTKMGKKLCCVLQRQLCSNVLSKYSDKVISVNSADKRVKYLLRILTRYDDENIQEEVIATLKHIPNLPHILNSKTECWTDVMEENTHKYYRIIKIILELGADLNCAEVAGMTVLEYILTEFHSQKTLRHVLEFILYENLDLKAMDAVVVTALQKDSELVDSVGEKLAVLRGNFILDCQHHGRFGHDSDSFALNFLAPLLIECGLPCSRDVEKILVSNKQALHPKEQEYIQHYLNMPRTLILSCRDTLRKHHRGRRIHTFIQNATVPQQIKDFILLKTLLKYTS